MKNLITLLTTLSLTTCMTIVVFAANGNKGDWGFEPKQYKYALIVGEITSIDHNKRVLQVKGTDEKIFFCDYTEFFRGTIKLPMERVFHPVEFNDNEKLDDNDVRVGDYIKSRYSRVNNDQIHLDTCLVVNNGKSRKSIDAIDDTTRMIFGH